MGTDRDSGLLECLQQQRNENADSHCAYGLDRYSWNQGHNAKYDCQIFENKEPALVARGECRLLLYQKEIGGLNATDFKWVQNQQVVENKLIICKR